MFTSVVNCGFNWAKAMGSFSVTNVNIWYVKLYLFKSWENSLLGKNAYHVFTVTCSCPRTHIRIWIWPWRYISMVKPHAVFSQSPGSVPSTHNSSYVQFLGKLCSLLTSMVTSLYWCSSKQQAYAYMHELKIKS